MKDTLLEVIVIPIGSSRVRTMIAPSSTFSSTVRCCGGGKGGGAGTNRPSNERLLLLMLVLVLLFLQRGSGLVHTA